MGMAHTLLSSLHVTAQHLIGILIIVIIGVLMTHGTLQSQAGMPLLSAVAGYLLGKGFKDISSGPGINK